MGIAEESRHLLFVLKTSIKPFIAYCQSCVAASLWRRLQSILAPINQPRFYCKRICTRKQTKACGHRSDNFRTHALDGNDRWPAREEDGWNNILGSPSKEVAN